MNELGYIESNIKKMQEAQMSKNRSMPTEEESAVIKGLIRDNVRNMADALSIMFPLEADEVADEMQKAQTQEPYQTSLALNDLQEYLYARNTPKIEMKVWEILELLHSRISRLEAAE
jgi:hypothetical protein